MVYPTQQSVYINPFTEITNFSPSEYQHYENSLKYYRDLKNSLDTAEEEGFVKGKLEGLIEGLAEGEKKQNLQQLII